MLVALYVFVVNILIPELSPYMHALFAEVMTYIIILTGIMIALGAVGMRVSQNLGATVVGGIFRAIGFVCRNVFDGLGWIIRNSLRAIPQVYAESKRTFIQMGLSTIVSTALSVVVVILIIVIII